MKKSQNLSTQDRALHRIRIIQGHLRCIENKIKNGDYCVDIIHQSNAVQKALRKLDMLILKDHLNSCLIHQIKNGDSEKSTEELMKLYEFK